MIATTGSGVALELDLEPERAVKAGDAGYVTLRRATVFAA